MSFPNGFLWGTSTAAYQIEGSPLADGASPSIWHEFSHRKGRIKNNHHGDIACDHYHRYQEDIRHLKELGVKAYRFSVSWPRIVAQPGAVNSRGIDYYRRIVDLLLEAGIEPYITLFHWETPLRLERQGGFRKPQSVDYLAEYGNILFRALGDRVKNWITINEPMVYSILGYVKGEHAPGRKNDLKGMFAAAHYLLLSHSRLVKNFRSAVPRGRIGIAQAQIWTMPHNPERAKDLQAAGLMDDLLNRLYIDPIMLGKYPEKVVEKFGRFLPRGWEEDLPEMTVPFDFVGVNYYTSHRYRYSPFTPFTHARQTPIAGVKSSAMWEIYPEGLYNLLMRLKNEYGNPDCLITENGYPLIEMPGADPLHDQERINYLYEHISAAGRAIKDGVNLKGYFIWSLLDNFEWQHGYNMRFGLIRVDFNTLKREWRRSAHWFRDLIKSGGPDR